MYLKVKTPATSLPFSVKYIRDYLHWIDTDVSTEMIIEDYIKTAVELFESVLNTSITAKTYVMSFYTSAMIGRSVELLRPPNTEVVSLSFTDNAGNETEITEYVKHDQSGVFKLFFDTTPNVLYIVEFKSGYTEIPALLKTAIAEQVGNWLEGNTELGELSKSTISKIGAYSYNLL